MQALNGPRCNAKADNAVSPAPVINASTKALLTQRREGGNGRCSTVTLRKWITSMRGHCSWQAQEDSLSARSSSLQASCSLAAQHHRLSPHPMSLRVARRLRRFSECHSPQPMSRPIAPRMDHRPLPRVPHQLSRSLRQCRPVGRLPHCLSRARSNSCLDQLVRAASSSWWKRLRMFRPLGVSSQATRIRPAAPSHSSEGAESKSSLASRSEAVRRSSTQTHR